jgi:hypothetical protein
MCWLHAPALFIHTREEHAARERTEREVSPVKNARVVFAQQSSLLATMLMCDCHLAPKAGLLFVLGAALTLLQCPIVLL